MAVPAWAPVRPAALKSTGMRFAMPRPTRPKPSTAMLGCPTTRATERPTAARLPETRSRRGPPSRRARASPASRPRAMASEKAANPMAAIAAERVAKIHGTPVAYRALDEQSAESEETETAEGRGRHHDPVLRQAG